MKNDIGKKILMLFFIMLLLSCAAMSFKINYPIALAKMFGQQFYAEEQSDRITIETIKDEFADNVGMKSLWIDLSGRVTNVLKMQNYCADSNIYITKNNRILSKVDDTSTDYEYEQTVELKKYLDKKGINFLYVNAPTKYLEDAQFTDEFAINTYANQNADKFLQRIEAAGVDCLDLRKSAVEDNLNIEDMFYKTDHHWTVKSGLWSVQKIAEELNDKYDYNIDETLLDESEYYIQDFKSCWLGEQGEKVGRTRVGLDDFSLIIPQYDTAFRISNPYVLGLQKGIDGDFNTLIKYSIFDSYENVYTKGSYHYSYLPWNGAFTTIHNNNQDYGKILLLGDSYSQVTLPFLAMGVSDITMHVMRNFAGDLQEDLQKYIEMNDFDTVIILYAETMIGAHDDVENSNYSMFQFDSKIEEKYEDVR